MEENINYPQVINGNEIYNSLSLFDKFKSKKTAYEILMGDKPGFFKNIGLFFANKTYSQIAKDYISNGTIEVKSLNENKNLNMENQDTPNLMNNHSVNSEIEEKVNNINDFRNDIKVDISQNKGDFEEKITNDTISQIDKLDLSDILVESNEFEEIDPEIQNLLDGIEIETEPQEMTIDELIGDFDSMQVDKNDKELNEESDNIFVEIPDQNKEEDEIEL